jgi:hypothetical protein
MYKTATVNFPTLRSFKEPLLYSLKIKQDRYTHDMGTITFRDWDLSEKILPPGTPVLITLNSIRGTKKYPGFVHHVKKVMTTEKRFVEITFIGASYRMKQKTKKVWKKSTVSQIAKTIAKKYKFTADITPHARVFPQIAQHGESDWEFLVKCAKKCGYYFRVDGTTLIFKPIDEFYKKYKKHSPSYNLQNIPISAADIVGSDIYSFTPIVGESIPFLDATKSSTSFSGVNPITKKINSYSNQKDKNGKRQNKKPPLFDNFDVDTVVPGNDIAKSHSDAFDEMVKFPYRAHGAVIGSPKLMPGMPILLNGVGSEYSGYWMLLSVEHIVHFISLTETKYTTNIEVGIDSLGQPRDSLSFLSTFEDTFYIEPNIRQIVSLSDSLLAVKSIPVKNEITTTFGSLQNQTKNAINFKNEQFSYWENLTPNTRLRQNKPSNRSVEIIKKLRRSCCGN